MKRNTKLLRVFLVLVATLLVANAIAALWHLNRLREHERLITHTLKVRATLAEIMNLLNEAETGQRGYVITGETSYLEPFTNASSQIHDSIDEFRTLTQDNLQQQGNVDELERRIDRRLFTMRLRLSDFDTLGLVEGAERMRRGGGQDEMRAVRDFVAEMDRLEAELVVARQIQADASYRLAITSSGIGLLFGLGLVVLAFIRLRRDIVFRNQSARVLGEQREWFRTVLASVGDAVIASGTDGRVTFMNPVAEELTGWTREQAIGLQLERVFHVVTEKTRELVENPAVVALRDGVVVGLANHTVLIAKNGVERSIDDSAAPIRLEDGTHVGAVLIFRDVTEKRLGELERVAAFEREQDARLRAEDANRLKDEFLATISHELRTPLNAILGWSAILRSENAAPEMFGRGLDTIERNARTQAQLIEDLLDASRITRGLLRLDVSVVDPARSIKAAIEAVQLAADARDVEIALTLAPDVGTITGDAQRVQQIVWNLVSNAIKFSPKGGRVDVVAARIGDTVEIAVSDVGRGIAPEFLPHVFERFRQADSSSSRTHGGVGLGLAIVKQLTELHGGTIEAASEGEGKGATFTVRLPIALARRPGVTTPATGSLALSAATLEDFKPESFHGLRVVVVDDEPETLELIRLILTRCDATVRTASSASAGLAEVRDWKPDLLISDIGMPDGDGYELIRAVRKLSRDEGGSVPAIALTGYARVEDRVRVLATGFQMHLTKPVEPDGKFVAVVASVVGFERQQAQAER